MTQEEFGNATPEQIAEELEKIKDPYYYYTTYWILPDGSKPTLTREEFEEKLHFIPPIFRGRR